MIPLVATHKIINEPTASLAYTQVKVVFVRNGSIRLFSDNNDLLIHAGDVTILPAETKFHAVPEPHATITSVFISPEYAVDLIYWQYRGQLENRDQARALAGRLYSGIRMFVPLGRHIERLATILDNMVSLSRKGDFSEHSNQLQAHWFTVAHALSLGRGEATAPTGIRLGSQGIAAPVPIRSEVLQVDALLRERPERTWTLRDLAVAVHLSPGHLSALCSRVWGYPPRIRLQLIRIDALAELLRESNLPVKQCIYQLGWRNHSHAAGLFRAAMGLAPGEYRTAYLRDLTVTLGNGSAGSGHEVEPDAAESLPRK